MEIIDILLENQAPTNKIINAILINSGLENSERKEEYIQKINEMILSNYNLIYLFSKINFYSPSNAPAD